MLGVSGAEAAALTILVFVGRFLIGMFMGATTTVLRAYIGETSSTVIASMPPEKRRKSTLKYTAFFITFSVCAFSVMMGPGKCIDSHSAHTMLYASTLCYAGIASAMIQIASIDQFRWPGYFVIVIAFCLGVATLVGFREKKGDLHRGCASINYRDIPIPMYVS